MAAKKNIKPEPVPTNIVCSVCGELWHIHVADAKGEVSLLECVRILKSKPCDHQWPFTYPWTLTYPYHGGNYGNNTFTVSNNAAIEAASVVN